MVVLDKASGPKAGSYVDLVGSYNPKTKAVSFNAERIQDWVAKGAQLSPSLKNLLIAKGMFEGEKKSAQVVSQKNLGKNIAKKAAEDAAAAEKAALEAKKAAEAEAKAAAEALAAAEVAAAAPAAEEVVVEATPEVVAEAEAAEEVAPAV